MRLTGEWQVATFALLCRLQTTCKRFSVSRSGSALYKHRDVYEGPTPTLCHRSPVVNRRWTESILLNNCSWRQLAYSWKKRFTSCFRVRTRYDASFVGPCVWLYIPVDQPLLHSTREASRTDFNHGARVRKTRSRPIVEFYDSIEVTGRNYILIKFSIYRIMDDYIQPFYVLAWSFSSGGILTACCMTVISHFICTDVLTVFIVQTSLQGPMYS